MRRLTPQLNRLLWLGAALAITALALVAPWSAAIFSRRAAAIHTRSLVSRSVQTSRLGISGDAIEDSVGGATSSSLLLAANADHDTEPVALAAFGVVPARVAWCGTSVFVGIPTALLTLAPSSFVALAEPRGPPIA